MENPHPQPIYTSSLTSPRGKQPLWLCKLMSYHIQPIATTLGIQKRIGWHTFRRTYSSILQEVVQELLRHSSTKMT